MYISFENMQTLINSMDNTLCFLQNTREKLEFANIQMISESEFTDITEKIKITENKLDEKIEAVKKLKSSLIKISEIYKDTEHKLIEKIDGERIFDKSEYSYYDDFSDTKLSVNSGFRGMKND